MSTCLRCLARLSSQRLPPSTQTAALSTSATRQLNLAKPGAEARGKKTLKLSKKRVEKTGRPPNPGERKAIRKRIVLSNTNAPEIPDLLEFDGQRLPDESLRAHVLAFPGPIVDSLRAIESFKPSQSWGFFRRPATLVRQETLDMANHIRGSREGQPQEPLRRIITGDKGTGKSVLLVQTQAMAFLSGWVVIHFPEGYDLTSATTEYGPLEHTQPQQYVQRTYTAELLGRIRRANAATLSKLQVTQKHELPIPLSDNMSLDQLVSIGAHDVEAAWPIYQALWSELKAPGRPPVLYSLDNTAHIARLSNYLTAELYNVHAQDLALVDHFLRYLTGSTKLPNGGIVLAADSASNRPISPSLDLAVSQSEEAMRTGRNMPLFDTRHPLAEIDPRVLATFRSIPITRLRGLTSEETRTMLEYYAKSGMLRQGVTEDLVSERWALSGGGIIGELERSTVRAHG